MNQPNELEPKPPGRSMLGEFKEFAMRGNVVDLAVGVVIGAAFGKIVTAFVSDFITPIIGKITGGVNFEDKFISLDPEKTQGIHSLAEAKKVGANVIGYGDFVTTVVYFIIIAFFIFMLVKGINKLKRTKPEQPSAPPEPTREEKILMEIRDILKSRT